MGERRPHAALEEPTGFPFPDEEPKHLGERLIDVDFSDRILRLRNKVLSFPNTPADVHHLALDVDILDIQPSGLTDPHPRSGEDGEQHMILASCCLDDSLQLLLRKVPLFRSGNATINTIDATFDGIDCDDGSGVRLPFSGRIRVTK